MPGNSRDANTSGALQDIMQKPAGNTVQKLTAQNASRHRSGESTDLHTLQVPGSYLDPRLLIYKPGSRR